MADGEFKDHFSDGSDRYAAYRPRYPVELVNALAEATPTRYRALDCACGNGQLSVLLAEQFQEVLAADASGTPPP